MAPRNRAASSIAASSSRRETERTGRGEKRERETGEGSSTRDSKRSRMAEAGASRDNEEEDHADESHSEGSHDAENRASRSKADSMDKVCPITDKDEKPFRLMDLPPEVRIEIYRACLTRPFDILLSREPKPAEVEKERAQVTVADEEREVDLAELRDEMSEHEAEVRAFSTHDYGSPSRPVNNTRGIMTRMRSMRSLTRNRNALNNNNNNNNNSNNTSAANTHGAATTPPNATPGSHNLPIHPPRGRRIISTTTSTIIYPPRASRPQDVDPLLVKLLPASKLVYKESRAILYGENRFTLDLETAQPTLAALHQRSRGQIKFLRVTIPTHNEILERFAEVVRLSLRYCWRLKRLVVHMPFVLPGAEGSSTSGNTTVYANAFDILRWLPKQCEVMLEGNVCEEIRRVVEKNSNLAKSLDELAYARRQLISNDAQRLPITR